MNNNKLVLVLFSRKNHKEASYKRIFSILQRAAILQNKPLDFRISTLDSLWIEIINNKLIVTDAVSGKDLSEYDFVDFNWWGRAKQYALAAAIYLKRCGIPFLTENLTSLEASSKIGEMALMSDKGIPLPRTFISGGAQILEAFKDKPRIDYPVIVKGAEAFGGRDNYLVKDYEELVRVIDDNQGVDFLVQEFIPNDCDYRCLVLGDEVKLILKRSRNDSKTHVNNTSSGGKGEVVPINSLNENALKCVLDAARVQGCQQFCGVDLMFNNETGEPYILEVNQTPEIEEGAEPEKKITALLDYIEKAL